MRESSVCVCPVPNEQQPLNEYQQLQESWFFGWVTQPTLGYLRKLAWVWCWGWLFAGPIAAASFPVQKHPLQFFLAGGAGALVLVLLVLLRLYLGWSYIRNRLTKKTVFYEESGWYDGQTWQKPAAVVMRDRLIVTYQIKPILARLQGTLAILTALVGMGSLLWLFANLHY